MGAVVTHSSQGLAWGKYSRDGFKPSASWLPPCWQMPKVFGHATAWLVADAYFHDIIDEYFRRFMALIYAAEREFRHISLSSRRFLFFAASPALTLPRGRFWLRFALTKAVASAIPASKPIRRLGIICHSPPARSPLFPPRHATADISHYLFPSFTNIAPDGDILTLFSSRWFCCRMQWVNYHGAYFICFRHAFNKRRLDVIFDYILFDIVFHDCYSALTVYVTSRHFIN